MNKNFTDDTITTEDLQKIHGRIALEGVSAGKNVLAERESALAAYVLWSAHQITETMRGAGAPPTLADWLMDEITARLLVVIEAANLAQYALWRDFMADPSAQGEAGDSSNNNNSKGNDNGEKNGKKE